MTSIGLILFYWKGATHIIIINHFSSLPMFMKVTRWKAGDVIKRLITWFAMYGSAKYVRADRGPPFSWAEFA